MGEESSLHFTCRITRNDEPTPAPRQRKILPDGKSCLEVCASCNTDPRHWCNQNQHSCQKCTGLQCLSAVVELFLSLVLLLADVGNSNGKCHVQSCGEPYRPIVAVLELFLSLVLLRADVGNSLQA